MNCDCCRPSLWLTLRDIAALVWLSVSFVVQVIVYLPFRRWWDCEVSVPDL